MKLKNSLILTCLFFILLNLPAYSKILKIKIDGPITPPMADFVEFALDKARNENAELIIITLNTPGGLDKSMRDITSQILSSNIPVCVYVYPVGARAGSAGAIIAISSHVLAMSSGTNIGSAHPINIFGEIKDKTLETKIVNDLKAYAQSLAQLRGKNTEIAGDFVEKSLSLSSSEAKEKNIADIIADDFNSLLKNLDGFVFRHAEKSFKIKLSDKSIEELDMPLYIKILNFISQPNLAYLLLIFGLFCIFFELSNPGLYVPALLGILLILLSFYGFHLLSANMVGVFLIILAMVLLIAEIYVTSFGLLGLSGIISLVLGNILLYKSLGRAIRFSPMYIAIIVIITISVSLLILYFGLKVQFKKPLEGLESLIGEEGECIKKISATKGKVFVHGEIWNAEFDNEINKGDKVKIVGIRKNILVVKKLKDEKTC